MKLSNLQEQRGKGGKKVASFFKKFEENLREKRGEKVKLASD